VTERHHLTPRELREKAAGMREEAAATRSVLRDAALSEHHIRGLQTRVDRLTTLAGELERAAQKAEATGV
jgi:hypothetical protein